jgi:hypothetical protein
VTQATHARLSASGAYRWLVCPGSVRLSAGIPDQTSVHAARGTRAHEVAAETLADPLTLAPRLGTRKTIAGHCIEIDREMVDAVRAYVDFVRAEAGKAPVQAEVDLTPALSKLHPDFGGTADCVIWHEKDRRLQVIDLKYGAGVLVEVEDNEQLMYYALGALLASGKPAAEVETIIYQPRTQDGVRRHSFPAVDLIEFSARLLDGAAAVEAEDPPLVPGEKQCRWCRAAAVCPELERRQALVVSDHFDPVVDEGMAALSPDKLARALDLLPLVEARIKALRELAYEEALAGRSPPGWKLVDKRGTRKWVDEDLAKEQLHGEEAAWTEPSLKSPAQVEKALGKKTFDALYADLAALVSSGYTLVPESDSRAPAMIAVADDFEEVPGET